MPTQLALRDISNFLYARKYAYDILRRFFIEEPSKDYLNLFIDRKMIDQLPFAEDSEGIREGIRDIKQYLREFDVVNNKNHYEDLHWDYTRMFIGPFQLPAPPWETVYVQKDKLLFGKCTMSVRKEYEQFGFEVGCHNMEAEDHIGLELDFIYHLNERCLEIAYQKENQNVSELLSLLETQRHFLNNHLLRFVPEFSEKVIKHADTGFYVGMAKILNSYLQVDSKVLKELLDIDITHNS